MLSFRKDISIRLIKKALYVYYPTCFLNGMAIAIVSGLTPLELVRATGKVPGSAALNADYYPPLLTGLRGNHPGSFEIAHVLGREHEKFDFSKLPPEEEYGLVIVVGGISGLAAACFWREKMGKDAKILVLDNHDDFGGHAKRNEFNVGGKTLLGYGGSESFQSPNSNFSPVVHGLMDSLGVSITRMKSSFDANFYPDNNLSRGVFFDKKLWRNQNRQRRSWPCGFRRYSAGQAKWPQHRSLYQ